MTLGPRCGLPLSYATRSLVARPGRTLLTAAVVALVVVACTLLLGLISSLKGSFIRSGHPLNLVILRKGSDNDGASQISREAYLAIRDLAGISSDARGELRVSPQLATGAAKTCWCGAWIGARWRCTNA